MDKIETILQKVFSLERPAVFFPIRHHSPACSFHVQKAIDIYKPDCVLIEGPCDTDSLIPCLNSAEPPVSIYYSYHDSEGRHACYYPMLEYSPELAAIKAAAKKNIPVHFIDLPFGSLVLGERELHTSAPSGSRAAYFDDYFFQRSRYIESLCAKENCRDYGELWEKLFEIPVRDVTTENFIKNMTTLCYFSRVDYPVELLAGEQNPPREAFMAEQIVRMTEKYGRVFVVTGGFHTAALMELVDTKNIGNIKPVSGSAYLIPYSFEECDQLTGYASGMPYPGYYQAAYENLISGENDFYRKTTLTYISKLAKALRKTRENISLSEEASAFAMGLGLASLREKNQPGVYEFLDGVRSSFVKGELNLATSFVIGEAVTLLRGEKTGKVGTDAPVPPIILDFEATVKSFRMDISTSMTKTITLDIVSKPRHREQSAFLHRLRFLEIPFAEKTYGPDYENRAGARLVQEKWDCVYSGRVVSALIEKSHLGGTVAEACENRIADFVKNHCHSSSGAAAILVKAGVMALFTRAQRLIDTARTAINNDHSFVALADCINSLSFLRGVDPVLRIEAADKLDELEALALARILPMIPSLTAADEKEDFALAESLKTLYAIASRKESFGITACTEAMADLLANKNAPPSADGAATGLLHNSGALSLDAALGRANAYFTAAGETLAMSGRFLRGLFLTAKNLFFYDNEFIDGVDKTIKNLPYDDFVKLLPDLRLAFASFSPRETDLIAKKVLELMSVDDKGTIDLTRPPALDEHNLKIISEIDRGVMGYLREKGYTS